MIKALTDANFVGRRVAKLFGVSPATVSLIKNNKAWTGVL
jgi:predicted transcriptional regulator